MLAGAAGAPLVPWRGLIEPLIVLPERVAALEERTLITSQLNLRRAEWVSLLLPGIKKYWKESYLRYHEKWGVALYNPLFLAEHGAIAIPQKGQIK